jgi:hypothetical protein
MAFCADCERDPSRNGGRDGTAVILKLFPDTGSWPSATASLNASQLNHHLERIRPDAAGLAAAAAFFAAALALRSPAPLRFALGGRFKVALFADLHYGENAWTDWVPAQDAASNRVMATVLDAEKPGT